MKVKPIDTTLAGQETHISQLSMQPWNTGRFSFPPSGLNSNELPFSSVFGLLTVPLCGESLGGGAGVNEQGWERRLLSCLRFEENDD